MNKTKCLVGLVITLMFIGCASNVMHTKKSLPDWYLNTPEDATAIYGIGEANGEDLGLTRQDAEAGARDEIVRQIEVKISNMIKRSKLAVGGKVDANVIRTASNQVASQTVSQISIIEREVITSKKGYIVYALAKMSVKTLKDAALKNLKSQEMVRQLDIDATLQETLDAEVVKLNGLSE